MADIRLLLDDIRSVHNVGSIFRTAESVGVSKIYCAGTTPVPIDRFGRQRKDFAKVSLGAEELVVWEHVDDAVALIKQLKKEEEPAETGKRRSGEGLMKIIALEQAPNSIDYRKVKIGQKTLIILGNEVGGVSKSLLKMADSIAEIRMKGKKESLNVSVAAGVFLYGPCFFKGSML